MKNIIIVWMQCSDEWKGRVMSKLSEDVDVIVRYHGWANAWHCINKDGKDIKVRLIPSGIVNEGKICMIAWGVIINPIVLKDEIEGIENNWIHTDRRFYKSFRFVDLCMKRSWLYNKN